MASGRRSCWECRWLDRVEYVCSRRGKLEVQEYLLHRPSPCCGWGRESSLDHVFFRRMEELARDCEDFEPLIPLGRDRDTLSPSYKTGTSGGEEERGGA